LSPTSRATEGVPPGNGDDGGLSPFFVGEDIGSSSMGVDAPGGRRAPDTHAIIPRVREAKLPCFYDISRERRAPTGISMFRDG